MAQKGDISNLDFVSIKSSLVDFLSKQSEFSGYSLEGSALNVLMDLLAYNTYYNAFYNNMVANETFLDSASKRASVVSLAKNLSYIPRSSKAAKATISIMTDTTGVLNKNTKIQSINSVGNKFTFVPTQSYILDPIQFDASGNTTAYGIADLEIIQGTYTTFSHIINDPKEKIKIPFSGIDVSTIKAYVLNSLTDQGGLENEWKLTTDITVVDSESKIFFIQEAPNGTYEAFFGDGVFGKLLENGNLIIFEFIVTGGAAGNNIGMNDSVGSSSFSLSDYEIETVVSSDGGSDKEGIESIRRNALKNYSNEERAVTATDYESLILKNYSNIESIRCWGGERNNPPQYGVVFASIKPKNSSFLTISEKQSITESLLKNKSVLGMSIKIIDPDILYVNLEVNVKYNPNKTLDTKEHIQQILAIKTREYASLNFLGFDDDFYSSDLVGQLLQYHPSIVGSSVTKITMEKRIYPDKNKTKNVVINFGNSFYNKNSAAAVQSSTFNFKVQVGSSLMEKQCYFIDDGLGNLKMMEKKTNYSLLINATAGTVDYTTGTIEIPNFKLSSYVSGTSYIYFTAVANDADIFTDFDTILSFDTSITRNLNTTLTSIGNM